MRLTARGRGMAKGVRTFMRGVEARWAERVGARRFEELKATLVLLVETSADSGR